MAKVLIIEDDETLLSGYSHALSQDGFEVSAINNALDGLSLAEQFKPDVILLDLLLPSLSGLDFLQQYQPAKYHPNVKVLVFSNMAAPSTIERAKALGATMYLTKSDYTPKAVAQLITELLPKA